MFGTGKTIERESRLNGCQGLEEGKKEVTSNQYGISLKDDENILKFDCGDGRTTL